MRKFLHRETRDIGHGVPGLLKQLEGEPAVVAPIATDSELELRKRARSYRRQLRKRLFVAELLRDVLKEIRGEAA